MRVLLAAWAASEEAWVGSGARSATDWLSQLTGAGYSDAAATLAASAKLDELPALANAIRQGELSGAQAGMIGQSATADSAEALVETARRSTVEQLRKACRADEARRRSNDDEKARHEKAHRERFFRHWTDAAGAFRFEGSTTVAQGAQLIGAIDTEADAVFKEAWAAERREPRTAYRLDALVRLATREMSEAPDVAVKPNRAARRTRASRHAKTEVVIRVDESRLRGEAGMCETAAGPVPVDEAIGAILADAFVKIVVRDGVDVIRVKHVGRRVPAEVQTAVLERDGYACVHCGSTVCLETHHYKRDFAAGGPTEYGNLVTLCSVCHDKVSNDGFVVGGGPARWTWIPPSKGPPP